MCCCMQERPPSAEDLAADPAAAAAAVHRRIRRIADQAFWDARAQVKAIIARLACTLWMSALGCSAEVMGGCRKLG
jgi:hypothetical protein